MIAAAPLMVAMQTPTLGGAQRAALARAGRWGHTTAPGRSTWLNLSSTSAGGKKGDFELKIGGDAQPINLLNLFCPLAKVVPPLSRVAAVWRGPKGVEQVDRLIFAGPARGPLPHPLAHPAPSFTPPTSTPETVMHLEPTHTADTTTMPTSAASSPAATATAPEPSLVPTQPLPLMATAPPPAPPPMGVLPLLVLDFETFYSAEYSMSDLHTAAYVFDPLFHVHGLGIRYPDGATEFRTDVVQAIQELQVRYGTNLEHVALVGHNLAFDYFILHRRYGLTAAHLIDTLSLALLLDGPDQGNSLAELAERHGLPSKGDLATFKGVRHLTPAQVVDLGAYCRRDLEITFQLAMLMLPKAAALPQELWAMEFAIKQFVERPIHVDGQCATDGITALGAALKEQLAATGLTKQDFTGDQRFVVLLNRALAPTGRTVAMKPGTKGPIPAMSRKDAEFIALLSDPDEQVRQLVQTRLMMKSVSHLQSQLHRLEAASAAPHLGCHMLLKYCGAVTGRFTAGDRFNSQNLPVPARSTGPVRQAATSIRTSLVAAPGQLFAVADAAQIEARVLSWLAGEVALHRAFATGEDVYSQFAASIFNCEVRKPRDDDEPVLAQKLAALRMVGKTAVLGLGYGMGAKRFITQLRQEPRLQPLFADGTLTDKICAHIVYAFREQYPRLKTMGVALECSFSHAFSGICLPCPPFHFARQDRTVLITLPSGRALVYPEVQMVDGDGKTHTYTDAYGEVQSWVATEDRLVYGNGFPLYRNILVENVTQAVARDLLVGVIYHIEQAGHPVVHHCHDEVTCQVPAAQAEACLQALLVAWRTVPAWAPGLVLDAEGHIGNNWMK